MALAVALPCPSRCGWEGRGKEALAYRSDGPCRRAHFRSREFLGFPTVTAGVRAEAGVGAGVGGAHVILRSPAYAPEWVALM
jgi:hypothetical protein